MKRFSVVHRALRGARRTYITLVDDDNACLLRSYPWSILIGGNGTPYVRRAGVNSSSVLLHHEIFGPAERVYHKNGNSLDNRRENLSETPPRQSGKHVLYATGMKMLNRLISGKSTPLAPHAHT